LGVFNRRYLEINQAAVIYQLQFQKSILNCYKLHWCYFKNEKKKNSAKNAIGGSTTDGKLIEGIPNSDDWK
jgi:hypothetical protein